MQKVNFKIGDVVTIKSHPMAYQEHGALDSFISHIPPLMCIKEIHVERKKEVYSKESSGKQISDKVKYLCTYFNQHKTTFEDKMVYQEMLISFQDLIFYRKDEVEEEEKHVRLINETLGYDIATYEYGARIFFKTYKLEKRKTFKHGGTHPVSSKKTLMTHTSPAFIISGFKVNDSENVYDSKYGTLLRQSAKALYKVMWYDSYQEKYREEYQPKEFFTDDSLVYGMQPHKTQTVPPIPPSQSGPPSPPTK